MKVNLNYQIVLPIVVRFDDRSRHYLLAYDFLYSPQLSARQVLVL